MAPCAPPQPMMPDGTPCGLTTTRSPTFSPVTSAPVATISPAGSWPRGSGTMEPPGPVGVPPRCRKNVSVPQMPQARILSRASLGPGTGRSTSTTSISPTGPVRTDFMVAMVLLSSSVLRWLGAPEPIYLS